MGTGTFGCAFMTITAKCAIVAIVIPVAMWAFVEEGAGMVVLPVVLISWWVLKPFLVLLPFSVYCHWVLQ